MPGVFILYKIVQLEQNRVQLAYCHMDESQLKILEKIGFFSLLPICDFLYLKYFFKVHLHHSLQVKSRKEVAKQCKSRFFFLFLLDNGRIRIRISD